MNFLSFVRWFSLFDDQAVNILLLDLDGNIFSLSECDAKSNGRKLFLHWRDVNVGDDLQNKKFERLIKACLSFSFESGAPLPPPVIVKIKEDRRIYIDVLPLPDEYKPPFGHAHALLNFRELETQVSVTDDSLREYFGLTPSEASLAMALTEGKSLKEASSRLGISIWTARSHLRSIFQKTDTHRQAELVSLITHMDH